MRTISFTNWKGGVGKTTLSVNTAYALAEYFNDDVKLLFIDTDKQANASTWFGANPDKPTLTDLFRGDATIEEVIQPTRYPNIDLIAADAGLLDVNIEILRDQKKRQDTILRDALEPVKDRYAVCIIDTPPDSNIPVLNGITIVDDLIAVTLPNRFSLDGIYQLQDELDKYEESLGLHAKIRGVLINQHTAFSSEIYNELKSRYYMFPPIRGGKNTQKWLDKVINNQQSIFEICPNSGYAQDLKKFVLKLVEIIEASYTGKVVL